MNFLLKILISALAVLVSAEILPGVEIKGFFVSLVVAAVLALLNAIVKPLLILLTLPLTIFTLGFFLLVINALIILMADSLVPGFEVGGFWWALLFSLILSLVTYVFDKIREKDERKY